MKAINQEFEHTEVIGQFRTFGSIGPVYNILEPSRIDADGRWLLRIELPASGEVIQYPYDQLVADPLAIWCLPIAFYSVVAETAKHHPKGITQVYSDIGLTLSKHEFERIQGRLYTIEFEDMANLFKAIRA